MSKEKPPKKSQLVTIRELEMSPDIARKWNEVNVLVNNPPPAEWLKVHPLVANLKYLPIERIEWLLTSIFQKWRVEIKSVQHIANSIVVCVRLFYRNPIDGEWEYHDGVGASPLQTASGAGAIDWNNIKSAAAQMAAPAAETYAIKDAAEKIGKLFGKDLNRKDHIEYENLKGAEFKEPDLSNFKAEENTTGDNPQENV